MARITICDFCSCACSETGKVPPQVDGVSLDICKKCMGSVSLAVARHRASELRPSVVREFGGMEFKAAEESSRGLNDLIKEEREKGRVIREADRFIAGLDRR